MATIRQVLRDRPSSKARSISFYHLSSLMSLLYILNVCGYYGTEYNPEVEENDNIDWKAWREWVCRHTPPHKRGGSSN